MTDEQGSALVAMSREECVQLLADHSFGRLAVVVDGQPVIFPVNYVLDGEDVVFRNDPGTKLTHASLDRVAFEVDEVDEARREGATVVVQGLGVEFTSAVDEASERQRELPLHPWAVGEKSHWVRIIRPVITGRRLGRRA
jgi:nitroimidazol reductase NimA-like FMN-containing flavoprotein (pyridoxamine 5'-phosphate oxidase superfamily)